MNKELEANSELSHYRIVSKLGAGGMGEVYLADDMNLRRRVAIKFLPVDLVANEQAKKRLLREARAVATLDHPNICTVHEVAEEAGLSFIVMQYVEGETLDLTIKRKRLTIRESLSIAVSVADALAEAHARGIVHRDIKSSNIILTSRGQPKVMDFGLAKLVSETVESEAETQSVLTTPGTIIGTVPYMSPEQVRGEHVDERSDIFSFGVVLYEMLTGQQPFAARGGVATISAILTLDPSPLAQSCPEAPGELQQIVTRCLKKDRQQRYQAMREVAIDLEDIRVRCGDVVGVLPSEIPTVSLTPSANGRGSSRREVFTSRRLFLWLAAIVIMLTVSVTFYVLLWRRPPNALTGSVRSLNSAAYDFYLRGKLDASSENRERNENAIKILQQVVQSDPSFAPAYAELARAYGAKANFFAPEGEKKKLNDDAQLAVEKALALDPNLAEAHFVRGYLLWTQANHFPHELAIQSFKRAIAIDPNFEEAHHQLGNVYNHIGLLDKSEEEIKKALALDPTDTLARFRLGSINVNRGNYEEALAVLKTVPREAHPEIVERARATALFQLGRIQEASDVVEDYLKTYSTDEGGNVTSVKALIFAKAGKEREAEETIQHAIQIGQGFTHFHHTTYNIAAAYALLNKPDEALKWLEQTVDDGFPCYPLFEKDRTLDSLRKDNRFIALMAKLKQKWERYNATL